MRLFDPPVAKIRKRLPRSIQQQYDEFVALAEPLVPADLSKKQAELVIGFVAAAWVASEHRAGRLPIAVNTGKTVQAMVEKCHEQLGSQGQAALDVAQQLMDAGHLEQGA